MKYSAAAADATVLQAVTSLGLTLWVLQLRHWIPLGLHQRRPRACCHQELTLNALTRADLFQALDSALQLLHQAVPAGGSCLMLPASVTRLQLPVVHSMFWQHLWLGQEHIASPPACGRKQQEWMIGVQTSGLIVYTDT